MLPSQLLQLMPVTVDLDKFSIQSQPVARQNLSALCCKTPLFVTIINMLEKSRRLDSTRWNVA